MLGRTHIAIALAATAVIINDPSKMPLDLTIAAVSAILPDIDTQGSMLRHKLSKYAGILSLPILLVIGYLLFIHNYFSLFSLILYTTYLIFAFVGHHRGFTHSLLGFTLFALILFMSDKAIILPAIIGYASHLIADLLTPSGIPIFYPYEKNFKIPIVKTGSLTDLLVGFTFGLTFITIVFKKFI